MHGELLDAAVRGHTDGRASGGGDVMMPTIRWLLAALVLTVTARGAVLAQEPKPPTLTPDEQKLAAEGLKLNDDAIQLMRQGKPAEAVAKLRTTLEIVQKLYPTSKYPDGHPDLATGLNNMGVMLHAAGSADEA